jgi:hypothetical protein
MYIDTLVELISPIILCFAAYLLARRFFKPSQNGLGITLIVSFVFGFFFILLVPYTISLIFNAGFRLSSWIIFFLGTCFVVVNIKYLIEDSRSVFNKIKTSWKTKNYFNILFMLIIIFFLTKIVYYILIRAVTDWDATTGYLVYAKSISINDTVQLTAFDFSRFTKPMGISFIYAWTYSLSSSISFENFRLIPLAFIAVTLLSVFLVAKEFCSNTVAKLSVIVFMVLPLQDTLLYYAIYYPDVAFYALILIVFFFLYKYLNTLELKFLLVGGISLGLSFILKAQTILFLPAVFFIFLPLIRTKYLRIFCSLLISISFLFLLSFITPFPLSNLLYQNSIIFLCFVILASCIVSLFIETFQKKVVHPPIKFKSLIIGAVVFLGSTSIALLWYLRNFVEMGTLIWLSSINEPNLQWAISTLSTLTPKVAPQSFLLLVFVALALLVHPVLGSAWIIPKVVGFFKAKKDYKIYLIGVWILGFSIAYIMYAFAVLVNSPFTLNPREIIPLAPFFSIFSAIGIYALSERLTGTWKNTVALCFLLLLGFFSLLQSLILLYYPISSFSDFFKNLSKLSLSTWPVLAHGAPDSALSWLLFGLVIGSLLLLPILIKSVISHLPTFKTFFHNKIHLEINRSEHSKNVFIFLLIASAFSALLLVPYIQLTYSYGGGNVLAFGSNQEKALYDGLYTDILTYLRDNCKANDVVLTIGTGSTGLQYKLDSVRLIDLTFPDNLASLKSLIDSNDTVSVINILENLKARYFLFSISSSQPFVSWLFANSHLLQTILNPNVATLVLSSGGWLLFQIDNSSSRIGWIMDDFKQYQGDYFSEDNTTMIVDKAQSFFWTGDAWGSGNITVPLVSESLTNLKEQGQGQINIQNGTNSRWRIYYSYQSNQDWSFYKTPSIEWFGENSGKTLCVYIDAPNSSNRYIAKIPENWLGWKKVIFPFSDMIQVGMPSLKQIKEISIGFYDDDNISGIRFIGSVILSPQNYDWIFTNNPQSEGLNYSFTNFENGNILNFSVWGKAEGFVSFKNLHMPSISTQQYNYIFCLVKGTENARWMFRLYTTNGSSYDFPWWGTPNADWKLMIFDMSTIQEFKNATLRNDSYLNVKTIDGNTASVYIDFYQIRKG